MSGFFRSAFYVLLLHHEDTRGTVSRLPTHLVVQNVEDGFFRWPQYFVVKVSDRGWHVTSSSPVPLKTRRVGERCSLNMSRAQTSSRWCGAVVRRGGARSGVVIVT
ncbi:hypothetical protein TNCV_5120151 [Trichonephila clavipes]|nr:hypothetical protein TNCV_5120151 [Trichonephila clavipes]